VPRRVSAALLDEHVVLVDIVRPDHTPADAMGLARVATAIDEERFAMGSVTVEPPVAALGRLDLDGNVVRAPLIS
jgi:hypothetical protein